MDARVHLDLPRRSRRREQPAQFLHHVQRRQRIMLGTGDIDLALDLSKGQMGAFLGVIDQPGAVKRGGGLDPAGIAGTRVPFVLQAMLAQCSRVTLSDRLANKPMQQTALRFQRKVIVW